MTKSAIGYSLLVIIALVFSAFIIINIYLFRKRNAVYFNKRDWSNNSPPDGAAVVCGK